MSTPSSPSERIDALYRQRPRQTFLIWSLAVGAALAVISWSRSALWPQGFLSPRRLDNLRRFLSELVPYPLQGQAFDVTLALHWAVDLWHAKGAEATGTTLALSVVSIVLAAVLAAPAGLLAARTLTTPQPFVPSPRQNEPRQRLPWTVLLGFSRAGLMLLRSVPEYLWAFLLLAVLGPSPWAIVLALALHNLGILGRLGAEVLDDVTPRPPAALRGLGAHRLHVVLAALVPMTLARGLIFVFYRWETCVREATVLGMLGVASLGFWIVDARARQLQDEMFFFVLLGAGLVLLGDGLSWAVRRWVRAG